MADDSVQPRLKGDDLFEPTEPILPPTIGDRFVHPTQYRFYLQKYPQGDTTFDVEDVEQLFKCRYVKMVGNTHTDAKNIYAEDYAEANGSRVWTPAADDVVYKSSEISLYLRWRSDECESVLDWSDKFFEYVSGQKLEWHDTFRPDRYLQLVLEKAPEIQTEILNCKPNYLIVKYIFNNFGGKIYRESQL